ncbi:MAG: hypothetical protein UR93_C0009G0024 [Berkelbacteria bacterium GW2011_GWA2_35_9]|uniref:Uncharacterized protein n=1 Tax=Berkelbacteria bacterium GW2011_GWA2_35_9 TaxID=1618333 RepID=A0A0G0DIX1_9BACT|nr:MAG: hypothetical protein UR93_C0009G0024 [Berkelbacteria bacterium GW2011_GWA2_35_9]
MKLKKLPLLKLNNFKDRWLIIHWTYYIIIALAYYYFITSNEFTYFHLTITLALIFSIYRAIVKHNEYLVFVGMFLIFDAFFISLARITLVNSFSSLILAGLVFFFTTVLNEQYIKNKLLQAKDFWAFNWLLILLTLELFFTLSFFPVNTFNKAILLTIFYWFYTEAMRARIETRFNRKFMIYLTIVFVIVFSLLVFSIPFEQRF